LVRVQPGELDQRVVTHVARALYAKRDGTDVHRNVTFRILQQSLPAVRRVLNGPRARNTPYRKSLSGSTTAGAQAHALDSYSNAVAGVIKESGRWRRRRPCGRGERRR
jgi:hypothetical protein